MKINSVHIVCVSLTAALLLTASGCRKSSPLLIEITEQHDSLTGSGPGQPALPQPPDAQDRLPNFDQIVGSIWTQVMEQTGMNTNRAPIVKVAKQDFHSGGRMDDEWIAKNLRIELNNLADGRGFFVDEVADRHANTRNQSTARLQGQWEKTASGYRLHLELIAREGDEILWDGAYHFR